MGVRYVIFFQDTNGLSMHGYAPLLGVSERFGYDFCSMAIVRRPGEKVGGICRMEKASGESLTCNVEYNQLEDVLRATTGVGDVANAEGNSKWVRREESSVAIRATSTCCARDWRAIARCCDRVTASCRSS